MDGGDYSDGITKAPIVIDNVIITQYLPIIYAHEDIYRGLVALKLDLEVKSSLKEYSTHSK